MLITGHLAASYIVSQMPPIFGGSALNSIDQIYIISWGLILDIDIIAAKILLKRPAHHHFLPTHTPIIATLIYLLSLIVTYKYFNSTVIILGYLALMIHLVLDDVSYWFSKIKLNHEVGHPQIFWLYPFDKRRQKYLNDINTKKIDYTFAKILKIYFTRSIPNLIFEAVLIFLAISLWIKSKSL